jgi:apolipoprotein N-acyltransferase
MARDQRSAPLDKRLPPSFTRGAKSMTRQSPASEGDVLSGYLSMIQRPLARIALVILSAVLLALAFAPYGQFYLAWIGLVPWLILVSSAHSQPAAFGWGWLGGTLYFILSFVYLLANTVPGAVALAMFLALYWGTAALVIRGAGLLGVDHAVKSQPPRALAIILRALGVGVIWVGTEWLWETVLTGMPWGFLGHSQSPLLVMCQVADITGVHGISFLVVLVNALVAQAVLMPRQWRRMIPACAALTMLLAAVSSYGAFRLSQAAQYPGPSVLVVQPNDYNFRDKSAENKQREYLDFHLRQTRQALANSHADLIVWSETTMPALNQEARDELAHYSAGPFLAMVHGALITLTQHYDAALLAGGYYVGGWKSVKGRRTGTDIRNSAYYYTRQGRQVARYDKVHLVPFGEYTPFKYSIPWLYRVFWWFGPNADDYVLARGSDETPVTFRLSFGQSSCRFVAPICFDGSDAALIAAMFRRGAGESAASGKRADFIVSISNEGWFRLNEHAQHLQAEMFRCIENRAPMARCVNTGISGFLDSCGRVEATIPVNQEGAAIGRLQLDRRFTLYTRLGDWFSWVCLAIAGLIGLAALVKKLSNPPAATRASSST